jgi:thiol-disulfide isomerase/thioredoxin
MRNQLTRIVTTVAIVLALAAPGAQAGMRTILRDLRGRVVYVDFWASWCVPCRESFPWMQALQRRYGRAGLTVVAVDVDRNRNDAQRFLRAFRPDFLVVFDPSGRLARRYRIIGMPTSVLIDRRGRIRFTHVGFFLDRRAEYVHQVRELLAQK